MRATHNQRVTEGDDHDESGSRLGRFKRRYPVAGGALVAAVFCASLTAMLGLRAGFQNIVGLAILSGAGGCWLGIKQTRAAWRERRGEPPKARGIHQV